MLMMLICVKETDKENNVFLQVLLLPGKFQLGVDQYRIMIAYRIVCKSPWENKNPHVLATMFAPYKRHKSMLEMYTI